MADTPMMAQYRRLKAQHRGAILFFRLGDFYEMFEDDAKRASRLLDLTLTKRNGIPMCGIPYHAAPGYVARLLKRGVKVAVSEQTALPADGREIATREVVRVVTPGTVIDEDLLEEGTNNYLVATARTGSAVGLASVDISTGEFSATSFPVADAARRARSELVRLSPREVIVQESLLDDSPEIARVLSEHAGMVINRFPDWQFDAQNGALRLKTQFGVQTLRGYGLEDDSPEVACAGVLLEYLSETAKSLVPHIRGIRKYGDERFVGLNESTQKNLELVQNLQDSTSRFSLLEVLDQTRTSMGARRLRQWIQAPLRERSDVERRLDGVEHFYRNQLQLTRVREILSAVQDLERLSARVAMEKAHAKDLQGIRVTLDAVAEVCELHEPVRFAELFGNLRGLTDDLMSVRDLIRRAICDEPSVLLTEGKLIRRGYDKELDRLHDTKDNARTILAAYLEEERGSTGIASLKLKYNRVLGRFLEVTKSNLGLVPPHFIRRQSLVGSERFTTERLGELESDLNSAEERIVELERNAFLAVRDKVREQVDTLLDLGGLVGELDVLQGLAYTATARGYTRPRLHDDTRLILKDARHPVVEAHLAGGEFVPNSVEMDAKGTRFVMLTGPNMAGKSTYLRQIALITVMAQMGSFVPAGEADIGMVDHVFCRVGASDNLTRGESTFLVEMNETAHILRYATERSLLIFDEVGRGTGTRDGLAIAWAVTDHILERIKGRTLFATHFHELTGFSHPLLCNMSMAVAEEKEGIVFLKRVREGPAARSYGIHVARLAGIPETVISTAEAVIDRDWSGVTPQTPLRGQGSGRQPAPRAQGELFGPGELVLSEIRSVDPDNTTPLEALRALERWKRELDEQ